VDGPVELGKLAEELAAWENDTTVDNLTKQQRKRVQVSLYQTHIQKLVDAGLIEYDPDTRIITLEGDTSQFNAYLEGDEDEDHSHWGELYIGFATVSGILFVLVALDVSVFSLVSETQVGILIIGAFGVLSIMHALRARRTKRDIPAKGLIRE
jgi:hypothetical protein